MKTGHLNIIDKQRLLSGRMHLLLIRADSEIINRLCALTDLLDDADLMLTTNQYGQIVVKDRRSRKDIATAALL